MQSNLAVDLTLLQLETERLRGAVADLQQQLQTIEASSDAGLEGEWDVWPYCWGRALFSQACLFLHSFHEKLTRGQLAFRNRRAIDRLQRRPAPARQSLRLVSRG